ncbi:MAG: hypothetical protein KAQ92_04170 [Candidatus Aenigmarchaeota archaeon]|nr:hypothetical protein [Candidatus Aenigmarchaeota archaeon]
MIMHKKAFTKIYESFLVFVLVSGLIIMATTLENSSFYDIKEKTKKEKIENICYSFYSAGYFNTINSSDLSENIKLYATDMNIDVTIKNMTDNLIISSQLECTNAQTKYCTSYILSSQYKNSSVYAPIKIIVCGC